MKKFNINEDKVFLEFLDKNIVSKNGTYNYLAKYIYKIFINSSIKLDKTKLSRKQKNQYFLELYIFLII